VVRLLAIARRLRAGMAARGIAGAVADEIVQGITSFALYGFPESHAASFALIAYASAYLKAHHPAAFACALMNAWPMGFYHPATIVQDGMRHGVRFLPIDAMRSDVRGTLERDGDGTLAVRLGLAWVHGLRREAAARVVATRPHDGVGALAQAARLRRDELEALAQAGALAAFGLERREALWQASAVERDAAGLLARVRPSQTTAPLPAMSAWDETVADYAAAGLTAGPHLVAYLRPALRARGVRSAAELASVRDGAPVAIAGHVIVRQRPGTAKGICFLTVEDETGLANVIVMPDVHERARLVLNTAPLLEIGGRLEKREGVIHVRAARFTRLEPPAAAALPAGHDYW